MTGRVLPFGASTHAAADALLPFYVNGTLRREELAFVEQHVQACEQCQKEIGWLRTTFAALAAEQALPEAPHVIPGALPPFENSGRQGSWVTRIRREVPATHSWMRWLLAAQLAAIAVLGTLLVTDTREVASYRALGTPNRSAQLQDAIVVVFDPGTTESEMRKIVLAIGARIVDGPTSTDAYVLEIPVQQAEQALQALRADRAVRLAERLGARAGR